MRSLPRAGAVLAALLLVGCAAPATPADPDLTVVLEQSRDNENRHLLQIALSNDGAEPVEVVRLQLRSPAFTGVAPTVREDVLAPGRRLAFPIAYGAADCRGRGPATVVVGHRRDRVLHEAGLDVPADDPLLTRLHERECRLAALGRTAALSFTGWTRAGGTARAELVLTRLRGVAPVAVAAVDGSVILTLRPGGPLPLALDGPEVRLPVVANPSRCDPHALAESKRTYAFSLAVRYGDGPPLTVIARPDPADLPLLEQLVLDVCR